MTRLLAWCGRILGWMLAVLVLALIGVHLVPVRSTVRVIEARPDTQYWPMAGGYRIAYTKLTPPDDVPRVLPIVYLHGGPGGYVHTAIIETLRPLTRLGHEIYLYDQHGSGLSDRLQRPKDSSFNVQVRDLHEIVERHVRADRVILIAHSHGARIAAHYVAQHPTRVASLVLSSPGNLEPAALGDDGSAPLETRFPIPATLQFRPPDAEQYRADTEVTALPMKVIVAQALALMFNIKTVSDAEADAALNTMAARFTRNMVCDPANVKPEEGGAGLYVRTGANWFGDVDDPRPAMRKFAGRVLVLQGECDFVPYAEAYEYVDLFPKARYQFVPGAGHIVWWEQPDAYLEAVRGFLVE